MTNIYVDLILLNKHFSVACVIQEKFNINSAVWNNDNVLVYTTTNHLKYALLNGDYGILRCLDSPVYVIAVIDKLYINKCLILFDN